MRASALSRGRPFGRICDACRQQQQRHNQQRNLSVASTSRLPIAPSHAQRNPSLNTPPRPAACSSIRWLSTTIPTCSSAPGAQPSPSSSSSSRPSAHPEPPQQAQGQQQPSPPQKTHYDFFPQTLPAGPPPAGPFDVDVRALRREFLQLQAVAHPDRQPDPSLKARAEAASARINEAYKTLSSPLARAQYLLSLAGRDVANDETAKVADPELLMEVLEAREQIEDAGHEHELEGLRRENDARERGSAEELARCFADGDLEGAVRETARLRYWVNIRETIDNWEPGKPVVLEH